MSAIYTISRTVQDAEIDPQGHVNNVVYISWMQEIALDHSADQGWPAAAYRQRNWSWVVRTHFVEYRRPLFTGDQITIRSWIANMRKFTSLRKYEILRNGKLAAKAETNWAFVDVATGRLMAIPPEMFTSFELVENENPLTE